jgi:antirestriction protein ArdC
MEVTDKGSGETENIPFLRLYHVFNAIQCEGLKNMPTGEVAPFTVTKPAEIVAKMPQPPAVKHGMSHVYYTPVNDMVGIPERRRFNTEDAYHASCTRSSFEGCCAAKRLPLKEDSGRRRGRAFFHRLL